MGFFEKVKNMFTEEVEDDDVKVEQIKKEVTHVAIKSPSIEEDIDDTEEKVVFTPEKKENKPIFFDEKDFRDLELESKPKKEKIEVKEKEIYGSKIQPEKEVAEEKKIFKPTPIISPVYGVLDKNYHKEDIVSRSDTNKSQTEESPIDVIRNKAYGTLEDELENTLFGSNSILFKKDEKDKDNNNDTNIKEVDEDVLTDLTDDISKELDELLVKKEKYIDEKDSNDENDEDLLGFIDSTLYKDGDE